MKLLQCALAFWLLSAFPLGCRISASSLPNMAIVARVKECALTHTILRQFWIAKSSAVSIARKGASAIDQTPNVPSQCQTMGDL